MVLEGQPVLLQQIPRTLGEAWLGGKGVEGEAPGEAPEYALGSKNHGFSILREGRPRQAVPRVGKGGFSLFRDKGVAPGKALGRQRCRRRRRAGG